MTKERNIRIVSGCASNLVKKKKIKKKRQRVNVTILLKQKRKTRKSFKTDNITDLNNKKNNITTINSSYCPE